MVYTIKDCRDRHQHLWTSSGAYFDTRLHRTWSYAPYQDTHTETKIAK